jgi:hypothetical protein
VRCHHTAVCRQGIRPVLLTARTVDTRRLCGLLSAWWSSTLQWISSRQSALIVLKFSALGAPSPAGVLRQDAHLPVIYYDTTAEGTR